ncbi:ABC transporter ATP-binding protein [Paramaledivibacter caminithermalis]|jgi:ABC-type nitrate/sulfonate/bicarbonate transport system ATPase subunit|uniref:ABC-type nitrate/sulfonate/bicarbonate transport system, ATPase component n=1 Tax=Paramaledivibacter caminithermalis (strain DSM 15212 / CIP 107654 / DViRD3) TaxID=1121301 RepID=A0A1M6QYI9_PARC5|nr:ABC transporter ATP-binding protein [Paramaledivibacter caminithermalis]SHK25302.1 ABC-type nitrate/sulfonate/bicarbonate transport system, ATPase component [Paramaledivibacter caminithermalis DSM 15212]
MNTYQKNKLSINNIYKSFDDILVVDDISLELKENEFVSLLGPSGSGKSTLFNIIAGLILPDKGKVFIEDKDFTGKTGRVSYMYQKDLLLPWKRIIDNVALPLVIKGINKKKSREMVQNYFKIFGLEGFEYKYPFQLSGGMRQRAALMRTYMFSEDIILLDEPFGGLDAITKRRMQYWLLNVLGTLKASILFITHDIDEAIFLSDRIYILSDRPAKIKAEINVELPRPRENEVITSSKFNELKKEIMSIL